MHHSILLHILQHLDFSHIFYLLLLSPYHGGGGIIHPLLTSPPSPQLHSPHLNSHPTPPHPLHSLIPYPTTPHLVFSQVLSGLTLTHIPLSIIPSLSSHTPSPSSLPYPLSYHSTLSFFSSPYVTTPSLRL
jgi:hypothetical protein